MMMIFLQFKINKRYFLLFFNKKDIDATIPKTVIISKNYKTENELSSTCLYHTKDQLSDIF